MKDEIKEILDNPKILMLSYGNYISLDDYVKLKDYITNLQQKYEGAILIGKELNKDNERANQYIDFYEDLTKQQINMINDYKTRNEKAIDKLYCYGEVFDREILKQFQKEMLDILQGGDK